MYSVDAYPQPKSQSNFYIRVRNGPPVEAYYGTDRDGAPELKFVTPEDNHDPDSWMYGDLNQQYQQPESFIPSVPPSPVQQFVKQEPKRTSPPPSGNCLISPGMAGPAVGLPSRPAVGLPSRPASPAAVPVHLTWT